MKQDASDFGAHWLAESRNPSSWIVWQEWNHRPYAVVPAGYAWDVIAMPQHRLTSAADHQRQAWTDVPVLADLGAGFAYVWAPVGTAQVWDVPGTTALGRPWWVAVPRPGGPQVPERQWITPPGLFPHLMDPAALREALGATATGSGRGTA
ncbi:hypothetical protein [Streptomyces sp. NPDC048623]|uniref:hypothetical protein n=1 Tax=Streptomyces sp. NPDC048623 TaxID=3155761 RepID=UPI003426D87E